LLIIVCPFVLLSFCPLHCLSFDLQLLITSLASFVHCIVYPSIYSFWLPRWHLLPIALSILRFTASDYLFGIFCPLHCLSFDLQLLITSLASSNFSFYWNGGTMSRLGLDVFYFVHSWVAIRFLSNVHLIGTFQSFVFERIPETCILFIWIFDGIHNIISLYVCNVQYFSYIHGQYKVSISITYYVGTTMLLA
jgi:hypothetical protein